MSGVGSPFSKDILDALPKIRQTTDRDDTNTGVLSTELVNDDIKDALQVFHSSRSLSDVHHSNVDCSSDLAPQYDSTNTRLPCTPHRDGNFPAIEGAMDVTSSPTTRRSRLDVSKAPEFSPARTRRDNRFTTIREKICRKHMSMDNGKVLDLSDTEEPQSPRAKRAARRVYYRKAAQGPGRVVMGGIVTSAVMEGLVTAHADAQNHVPQTSNPLTHGRLHTHLLSHIPPPSTMATVNTMSVLSTGHGSAPHLHSGGQHPHQLPPPTHAAQNAHPYPPSSAPVYSSTTSLFGPTSLASHITTHSLTSAVAPAHHNHYPHTHAPLPAYVSYTHPCPVPSSTLPTGVTTTAAYPSTVFPPPPLVSVPAHPQTHTMALSMSILDAPVAPTSSATPLVVDPLHGLTVRVGDAVYVLHSASALPTHVAAAPSLSVATVSVPGLATTSATAVCAPCAVSSVDQQLPAHVAIPHAISGPSDPVVTNPTSSTVSTTPFITTSTDAPVLNSISSQDTSNPRPNIASPSHSTAVSALPRAVAPTSPAAARKRGLYARGNRSSPLRDVTTTTHSTVATALPMVSSQPQQQLGLSTSVTTQPLPQAATHGGLYRRSARHSAVVTTSTTVSSATTTVGSASASTIAVVTAPPNIYRLMSGRVPRDVSTHSSHIDAMMVDAAADAARAAIEIAARGSGVLASFGAAPPPVRVCIPAELKKSKDEITAQRVRKGKSGAGNVGRDVSKHDRCDYGLNVPEQVSGDGKSMLSTVECANNACGAVTSDAGNNVSGDAGAMGADAFTAEPSYVGPDTTGVVVAGIVVKKSRYRRQVRVYQGPGRETATATGKLTHIGHTIEVENANSAQNAEKRVDNSVNGDDSMEKGEKRADEKEPVKRSIYRRSRKSLQTAVVQDPAVTGKSAVNANDSNNDGFGLKHGTGLAAHDNRITERVAAPVCGPSRHIADPKMTGQDDSINNKVREPSETGGAEDVERSEEEEEDSDCEFLRSIMAQATSRVYTPPPIWGDGADAQVDERERVSDGGGSGASAGGSADFNVRDNGSVVAKTNVFNKDVREAISQLPTLSTSVHADTLQITDSASKATRAPTTMQTRTRGRWRSLASDRSPVEPQAQATRSSSLHSIVPVAAPLSNVTIRGRNSTVTGAEVMTHDVGGCISAVEYTDRAVDDTSPSSSVHTSRDKGLGEALPLSNSSTVSGDGGRSEAPLGRGVSFSSIATTQAVHDPHSTTESFPHSPRTSSSFSISSTNSGLPSYIPASIPIVLASPRIRLYKAAYEATSPPAPVHPRPMRGISAGTDGSVKSHSTAALGSSVPHVSHTVAAEATPALTHSLSTDSDDTIPDTNPFLRLSQTPLTCPSTASSPPSPTAYTPPPPLQAGPLLLERHSLAGHAIQRPIQRCGIHLLPSADSRSVSGAAVSVFGASASRALIDEDCYVVGSGARPPLIANGVVRGVTAIGDANSASTAKYTGDATTQQSLATAAPSEGRNGMRRVVSLLLQDSDDDCDIFASFSSSSSSTLNVTTNADTSCRKGDASVDPHDRNQDHSANVSADGGSGADDDDICVIEVRSPLQTRNRVISQPQNTRPSALINITNTSASACGSPSRRPVSPKPPRFLSPASPRAALAPLSPHSSPRFLSPAAHAHKAWCSPAPAIRGRTHTQHQAQPPGLYHGYGAGPGASAAHTTHAPLAPSSPTLSRSCVGYPGNGVLSPRRAASGVHAGDVGGYTLGRREHLANVDIISVDDDEPAYVPAPVYGKRSIFSHYGLSGVAARGVDADQENRPESGDTGIASTVWLRRRRRGRENTSSNGACNTAVSDPISIQDSRDGRPEAHPLKRRKTSPVDCTTPSPQRRRVDTDTRVGGDPTWGDGNASSASVRVPLSVRRRATFVSPRRTVVDVQ